MKLIKLFTNSRLLIWGLLGLMVYSCRPLEITENLPKIPKDELVQTSQIDINWGEANGVMKPEYWAVNDYAILYPGNTDSGGASVNKFLQKLKPAAIRIHNANLMELWTSSGSRNWNVKAIKEGFLTYGSGYGTSKIMLNINTWPRWLAPTNSPLPEANIPEFENLMRQCVRVMRDSLKKPIAYWEVTNELDKLYEDAGQLPRLWELYGRLATAIKAEDPNAVVGGPAFRNSNLTWFRGFMGQNATKSDFLSWHYYRSGNPNNITDSAVANSNPQSAFDNVDRIGTDYPGTKTWLTEFNVQWTWDPLEVRHGNIFGALYQYNIIRLCQKHNFEGAFVWHLKGNAYGLMDDRDSIRTTGNLFILGNKFLIGTINKSSINDGTTGLDLMAITGTDHKTVLFCNKSRSSKRIRNNHLLLSTNTAYKRYIYQLQQNRFGIVRINQYEGDMVLPPYSITVISTKALD